ncbi:MAG TPA: hypothetical protein VNY73_02520 [Bacteroidia bacterium]|jgi:hypothetical protein|nr:hypothetical protein [Bacteroidia bacterium]
MKKNIVTAKIIKSKYKSFAQWRQVSPGAYAAAKKKGMLEVISKRFGWPIPKRGRKRRLELEDLTIAEEKVINKIRNYRYLNKEDMRVFTSLYLRRFDFGPFPALLVQSQT